VNVLEVMEVLNGRAAFDERHALELVDGSLKQLKAAPIDEQVAFVFEALAVIPRAGSIAQKLGAKALASNLLRSGLPLNTLGAVRLVERSSLAGAGAHAGDAAGAITGRRGRLPEGICLGLRRAGDTAVAADIGDFACACFRKIPQIGAVSHRVGNACVNALAGMPGLEAVTQLSRMSMRVKYDVARRLIEKALMEAAERNAAGRDDLEAMSVPSFGLNGDGVRTETMGSCQASLTIENGAALLLAARGQAGQGAAGRCEGESWRRSGGLVSGSLVTSTFAKRRIWEIENAGEVQTAVWRRDSLVDWAGTKLTPPLSATVRLWHPIRSDVQTVLSWRCWFEDHEVRQPFKQSHREVDLFTDAERHTETYSNAFAAHITRQHQFAARCRERGWQFNL